MPIYEYVCNVCGHEFEEWQKITDSPVRTCPSCSARKVERLVSMSTFHLKGGGWYVTDYAGKKPSSVDKSSNASDKSEKSDSKTAPAAENKTSKTSAAAD